MKNSRKSKPLLSNFIDFIFIVLFITVTILTVSVTKAILYPEEKTIGELKIRSELMPREYKDSLAVGDVLKSRDCGNSVTDREDLAFLMRDGKRLPSLDRLLKQRDYVVRALVPECRESFLELQETSLGAPVKDLGIDLYFEASVLGIGLFPYESDFLTVLRGKKLNKSFFLSGAWGRV